MKSALAIAVGVLVATLAAAPAHAQCTCAGGTPSIYSFTSTTGTGSCGHLDADGNPNFFQLQCGGLYFGGAGVGLPLPATLPDSTTSLLKVSSCVGNTLSLSNTTAVDTGSNRTCTSTGCFFGGPLSIPNLSHGGSSTSTCVINVVATNATGSADCGTGATNALAIPLSSNIYLDGDLIANRCSEDGSTCPTAGAPCGASGKGTCLDDTARCKGGTDAGKVCVADSDCAGGTCETGQCVGGDTPGVGCNVDADCPGTAIDGDDAGCKPSNKNMLKCGDGISKAASKLAASLIACHVKQEAAVFNSKPFDEEACEELDPVKHKSAHEVFDAAIAKIAPLCTQEQLAGANSIRDTVLKGLDLAGSILFCDGTTPIDPTGEDGGLVPSDKTNEKCEEGIAKAASKLAAGVIKCHIKAADSAFGSKPFDEEACEETDPVKHKGAHEVFNAAIAKLAPVCTKPCQAGAPAVLAAALIATAEQANGKAYPCGTCQPLVQPCPVCNVRTNKCQGGPNDGLACTPADSATTDAYPTSHDCPPPPGNNLGALPINFILTTGTSTVTATDLPSQTNVFCGFCRSNTGAFRNPATSCTSDAGCTVAPFTHCEQRNPGAFTGDDLARTITTVGSPATGGLTVGGPAKSSTLSYPFCIPPTFNALVDVSADLPGPGAASLPGSVQLLP